MFESLLKILHTVYRARIVKQQPHSTSNLTCNKFLCMNASRMAGRQLRARKEVCYNQEALELGIFSDEDDLPISLRPGGEKKDSKNANRQLSALSFLYSS